MHDDDATLTQYGATLVDFLSFLIKSMDDEGLGYKLPMSEVQLQLTRKLRASLEEGISDVPTMHKILYSYMAPPSDDDVMAKWSDAIQCFLAVINLRPDATFTPAGNFTQELAHWEYLMRGAGLYETVTNHSGFASAVE